MIGLPGIRRHTRLRELLSAYIDGEVSASESRRVDEHLASCEECRTELAMLRSTVTLLGQLPELAVPRSFALRAAPQRRPAPPMVWTARLATSAAAVLLVALLLGDVVGLIGEQGAVEEAASIAVAPAGLPSQPAAAAVQQASAPAAQAAAAPVAPPSAAPAPLQAADSDSAEAPSPVPDVTIASAIESAVAPAPAAAAAAPAPAAAAPPPPAAAAPAPPAAPAQAMAAPTAPTPAADEGTTPAQDDTPQLAAAAEPPVETEAVSTQSRQAEPEAAAAESMPSVVEGEAAKAQDALADAIPREEPTSQALTRATDVSTQETLQEASEDGGRSFPLWQLEVAAGILLAALVATTLWVTRREQWRS